MRKILAVIGIISAIALGSIGFLAANRQSKAASSFQGGGYILGGSSEEESSVPYGTQFYFNDGAAYSQNRSSDTISFKTISGDKATVKKASFVHYNDDSMEALEQTAILDTDRVDVSNRSYYSIPAFTLLQKNGTQYSVDSNGSEIILENAIWKLSDKSYMVVSPTIEFVISADSKQTFQDFVQVEYGESGIVDLATQQGTYRTISSDAYLEMANGVQIYLGSKNLSNGQKILMNMTQMVVNSEDTIEPIPDSQYNNENVEEPKIVVEASDGEDGKDGEEGETGAAGEAGEDGKAGEAGAAGEEGAAGEDGEDGEAGASGDSGKTGDQGKNGKAGDPGKNGENGANGNPGNPGGTGNTGDSGDEGDPGDPGQNSRTANVNFTEEKSPIFSAELTPGLYSLKANIKYNENGTQVKTETTRVSIVETSSGLTVWSVTPGDDVVKGSGFEINCDSLAPGKNYALVVNTAYLTGTGKEAAQDVLTKYFVTESVGLTLDPKGSTDSAVNARVRKTEENPVEKIFVKLYDENQQLLQTSSFMKPVDGTVVYDDTEGFSVSALKKGESIDVSAQGTHNTVYYAQIAVTTYGESVSANYSFPLVKLQTLKLRPTLDAPDASVIGTENAFRLEAGQILDPDNGIVSYRYEVYPAGHVTEAGPDCEPVYTIDLNNPKSAKVPVGYDTGVEANESYRMRLVAIFHDNQSTLEYPSPFSAPVSLDSSKMWPVTTHTEKIITASTVEGTVVIRDDYQVIPLESDNRIHVKIQPVKPLKKPTATGTEDWQESFEAAAVYAKDFEGKTVFEIPYKAQGLKAGTAYNVYVTVDTMTANGSAGTDVMVSGFSVTTKDTYPGLRMNGVPGDTDDGLSFRQYIFFTTAQSAEEEAAQAQISSGITGVENLSHFASKSLEYLCLYLYDGAKLLGTWYREGTDGSYLLYDRRYQDVTKYPFILNEQEIGSGTFDRNRNPLRTTLYTENSIPSENPGDWCKENGFGVEVTIEDFVDETGHKLSDTEIATLYQGRTLTIRAEAYDYTYRTGGQSASYVDTQSGLKTVYCNPIPVVNELTVELGVPAPSWDIITASMKADPIKKSDLKENDFALQKAYLDEQTKGTRGGSNAWDYLNYTGKNLEGVPGEYAGLWDELNDDTIIGYRIFGPAEGMNYYAAKVRYGVYSSREPDPETGRLKEGNLVTWSPWIENPADNQDRVDGRLPSWDFLLEIPGEGTGKPVIDRGQDFYVKVQVEMNNRCDIAEGEGQRTWSGQIYPDWFEEKDLLSMGDKRDMFFGLVAPRQRPSISLVQWDGTIGENVQYLVKLVDVDEALRASDPERQTETETTGYSDYHKDYGHISFYQDGVFKNAIRMSALPEENLLPQQEEHFLAVLDVPNGPQKSLTVQYRLYEDNTLLDPSSHEAEWKTMELDPYRKTGLIGVKTATLLNQTEAEGLGKTFLKELDPCIIVAEDSENYNCVPAVLNETEHTISFRYYFFDAAGSDGFAKYVLTVAGKKGSTVEGRYTKEFSCNDPALTIDSKTVTVEPESKQFYMCEYTVDYTTDPGIIGLTGYDTIEVKLEAYRETGNYGLKYAATAGTHYAMQKRDEAVYYRPNQTASGLFDALVYSGATAPSVTISSDDTLLKAGSITIPFEGCGSKPTVYSYSADALDYIPREAKVFSAEAEQPNPLESILPTYAHKEDPGFSEARITLTLDGKGSIRNDSNYTVDNDPAKKAGLMLFYTTLEPSGNETFESIKDSANYKKKPLQITDPEDGKCTVVTFLGTDVDGEGHKTAPLDPDQKYYCLLYGFSNGVWSLLETIDSAGEKTPKFDFTTLEKIDITQIPIAGSEYYQYYSKRAADGNVKAVRMKFHVPAVTYSDLQYAVQHLYVSAQGATDHETAISQTDLVSAMLEAFPDIESSLPQEFDFITELPWSSAAARIMEKTYEFLAEILYPSGEPGPIAMQGSTPKKWPEYQGKNGNGQSYLTLLVSADYDSTAADEDKAGTVAVRVTGKDTQWLFRGLKSGKNPGEDDNIESDTQVKIRVSIYKKSQITLSALETKTFDRTISANGTVPGISEKDCIFKGLQPGESYTVKAKVYWDENNNGKIDTGEEYVVSRTTGKLPLAAVSVNSTMLNFEGSQGVVLVQGYNLSYVTKIVYQLRKDGTDLEQKTISTQGGDYPWTNWGIDPQRLEPNWKLTVPEMDDPGSVYVLKVTFYTANGGKVGDGEYTVQWGQETVSPAAELMRSFLNWLGG